MNISQFLKSLGLEHLRDIFEREQVRSPSSLCRYEHVVQSYANVIVSFDSLSSCSSVPALSFPSILAALKHRFTALLDWSLRDARSHDGWRAEGPRLRVNHAGHSFAHRWREQAPAAPCEPDATVIVQLASLPELLFLFLSLLLVALVNPQWCRELANWLAEFLQCKWLVFVRLIRGNWRVSVISGTAVWQQIPYYSFSPLQYVLQRFGSLFFFKACMQRVNYSERTAHVLWTDPASLLMLEKCTSAIELQELVRS